MKRLLLCLVACGHIPPPALSKITPTRVRAGVEATLSIDGSGLEPQTSVDIDTPSKTAANLSFTVTADNATSKNPFSRVSWVNDTQLKANLPSVLTPGLYDVTVTRPDGATATLPAALTISP